VADAPAAEPTLYDFVLKLISDPSAQQAFDLDPVGCLTDAGLPDLTPGDVHDAIPLVKDLIPTDGLPSLPDLGGLTSGLSLAGEAGSGGGWVDVDSESPLGAIGGIGKVDAGLDGVLAGAAGEAETALGKFGIGLAAEGGLDGIIAGAGVYTPLGEVEGHLAAGPEGADAGLYVQGPLDKFVAVNTEQGIGDVQIDQSLLSGLPTGDLAKGLADPTAAASALAGAVPALPVVDGLPGLGGLPGVGDLPVGVPDLGGLPVGVPDLGGLPVEVPSLPNLPVEVPNVPALPVDGLPDVTGGLPDVGGLLPNVLPNLPDVGGLLPNLPNLPVELPNLPVDVPQLPNLPLGDSSGHSPVGDVVDQTGLGNVINNNPVTDLVHDVVPDLHLGL
jgi:hypothetical protein